MKNYFILTFALLLFIPAFLSAQLGLDDKKARLNSVSSNEDFDFFDLTKSLSYNQYFYNNDWMPARILGNDKVKDKDLMIKYDILNQEININIHNVPMIASNHTLSGFELTGTNKKFLLLKPRNKDEAFFEVIVDGGYTLLKYHYAKKQKANYNKALDTGDKNEKVIKKESYYLMKGNEVFEIPRKKRAGRKFFSKYENASTYLKSNKTNFKNEEELKTLIQFLNSKKIISI